jgi:hypothetical protein
MLMATPMSKPMPWCWPWAGQLAALGSDGAWVPLLQTRQVEVAPLLPANCGFELDWSEHFRSRFAGEPIKPVVASTALPSGGVQNRRGEFIITADGIEGSLVYAMSSALRDTITAEGSARLYLDLLPDWPLEKVEAELAHPRGAFAVQPPAKPPASQGREGRPAARAGQQGRLRRHGQAGARHQGPAADGAAHAPHRRSHQQRRWRQLRGAR